MKKKEILQAAFIILMISATMGCAGIRHIKSDEPLDAVSVKNMIDSQKFTFIPRYVNPVGGAKRNLSTGYEIVISKDTIVSYLPFFGHGYTAPVSPADVDFDFTSIKFSYTISQAKNGWNISIKPKDQRYLQELFFRIFSNASASLVITSINRSTVSYDGFIGRNRMQVQKR